MFLYNDHKKKMRKNIFGLSQTGYFSFFFFFVFDETNLSLEQSTINYFICGITFIP